MDGKAAGAITVYRKRMALIAQSSTRGLMAMAGIDVA
jgi:hypothetical protein